MGFEVIWTDFAIKKLKEIFEFHTKKASPKIAEKLTQGIVESTEILKFFSLKGEKEIYLADFKNDFRHLIFKNYKIIYWVNLKKKRIEIVHIFDARQNPKKIRKMK